MCVYEDVDKKRVRGGELAFERKEKMNLCDIADLGRNDTVPSSYGAT